MSADLESRERVRALLVRGDNQLKGCRELVERRIESLRALIAGPSG